MDQSNGYESVAAEFLAGRGGTQSAGIGVKTVGEWARNLSPGAAVLDLGCGSGRPITEALVSLGLEVYAIDAAPTLVEAFRRNLPDVPVICEAVQESAFFRRTFDGVLAWGLVFLLSEEDQLRLLRDVSRILVPGGRFLFTSPSERASWRDVMTGLQSRSLGAEEYRKQVSVLGLRVVGEYDDEGENHYFDVAKDGSGGHTSA
jgi:SAM-dependent methyltransferase